MSLPSIRPETWRRICRKKIFIDTRRAQKFVIDVVSDMEKSNPYICSLLIATLFHKKAKGNMKKPDRRKLTFEKQARFAAANCVTAIYRLLEAEAELPIISDDVYAMAMAQCGRKAGVFVERMMDDITVDRHVLRAVIICSEEYEQRGYRREALLVQTTAFVVYKMLTIQSEYAMVSLSN